MCFSLKETQGDTRQTGLFQLLKYLRHISSNVIWDTVCPCEKTKSQAELFTSKARNPSKVQFLGLLHDRHRRT